MARGVRVLESLLPEIIRHARRSEFWAIHQLLEEAADPFDANEVGCVSAWRGLRREAVINRGGVLVDYWEHPDGEVEIVHVSLPD